MQVPSLRCKPLLKMEDVAKCLSQRGLPRWPAVPQDILQNIRQNEDIIEVRREGGKRWHAERIFEEGFVAVDKLLQILAVIPREAGTPSFQFCHRGFWNLPFVIQVFPELGEPVDDGFYFLSLSISSERLERDRLSHLIRHCRHHFMKIAQTEVRPQEG